MARDDSTLPLVAGIALVTGAVAWALWPKAADGATLRSYAPTPEGPMSTTMPAFLAAAPAAGAARERYFEAAVDAPTFVRIPVGNGLEIAVSSDYMTAQGIHVPMWPTTAQRVADRFGSLLPTKRIVDLIWQNATVKVPPRSMTPRAGVGRASNQLLAEHEAIVSAQIAGRQGLRDGLKKSVIVGRTASQKARGPDPRVTIYGWHRANGVPIQDPTWIHALTYSPDYSHGIRLVSKVAYLNGQPVALESLFANPQYAPLLSETGTLTHADLVYPTSP